ncbi:T9SS type A sorting domain-containing protein [Flavobacterium sp. IMCC34852]|uniref:T9SS type A sorting domain-containing protein n=1 Tax=Flavobacterium rivulicola TaxID=2732161 RepID=A0A7Y3VZI6_9FLAO|nr:T9SS type A sorting domain-containing protein [Flavobacterium sp. IMCC34852]NNT72526.1 T9SS type A sorting domain-containing protein [Flavobacterium sp. IMCC34852]
MKKLYFLLFLISGLTNAQIINFPDANLKAVLVNANPSISTAFGPNGYATIDTNADGEIQVAEALAITGLSIQSAGITDFTGIENFSNITGFGSYSNSISNLNLSGMTQLQTISLSGYTNGSTVFSFSNLPALTNFNFIYSNITSLTLTNLPNLATVGIWGNTQLTELNLIGLTSLNRLTAFDCAISNLSITNSPVITEIDLSNSNLTSIPIVNYPLLKKLNLSGNNLTDTSGFTNLNNLEELNIQNNQIANLVLPVSMPALKFLWAGSNGYATINLSGYPNLRGLSVNNNNISSLDLSNLSLLQQLLISFNPIASCDFSGLVNLTSFGGASTLLSEIDFSNSPLLNSLSYSDNPNLTHINLKSGTVNTINYSSSSHSNLPNLMYICVDEGDTFTYSLIANPPTVPITSYCSFVPGGDYNTITGTLTFDANNNGCDTNDAFHPYMKFNINDGTVEGSSFTNAQGEYTFYTQAGSFDLTPNIENPSWFTFSPSSANVVFADNNNNTATQNFCVTANGVHPDLEIVISPVIPARPGFDAVYKIVYRNKGNQILSQQYGINFFYNQNLMDFVSTSVAASSVGTGSLSWDYANLQPFESRFILVTFNINAPTDSNPVNIADILTFTTSILPQNGDENTTDNLFVFNQIVVGSYDPNDVTCLEGDIVAPSEIGDYLHYMIRFENTGTAPAENIVVRTDVNPADFDVNSLQLLNASHEVFASVNGNTVEFIFENIMLESGGHGNVLLKVKSRGSLQQGDNVNKRANIYFDYNYPVETNDYETIFQALSNPDFETDNSVSIYPNPSNGIVNIKGDFNIKSIQLFDVQGRILQTNIVNENNTTIDIAAQNVGVYFIRVVSDKGIKVEKLVKQ